MLKNKQKRKNNENEKKCFKRAAQATLNMKNCTCHKSLATKDACLGELPVLVSCGLLGKEKPHS